MHLGAFSISLAVKDLAASRAFYEDLGFMPFAGDGENWQMMRSGDTVIGLFQGMFEANILTFNPGWNQQCDTLEDFMDVRAIQASLKDKGISLTQEADPAGSGPASAVLTDPDGNVILLDQHV
jgi:lactoylglutathione lyase